MSALWEWLVLGIILIVALVWVWHALIGRQKRAQYGAANDERMPHGTMSLRVTLIGAILYAAVSAISTIGTIVAVFVSRTVQVSMPVATFWPKLLPSVHIAGPTAHVNGGGFEQAEVWVSGLSMGAKLWLASGNLLEGLTYTIIGLTIAGLCFRILRRDPFRSSVTGAITVTAVTIVVGGLGWQVCYGLGGWLASQEVLNLTSTEIQHTDILGDSVHALGWPSSPLTGGLTVDFWPVFLALALAAVAAAFRYGAGLESDKAKLQNDTAGLV